MKIEDIIAKLEELREHVGPHIQKIKAGHSKSDEKRAWALRNVYSHIDRAMQLLQIEVLGQPKVPRLQYEQTPEGKGIHFKYKECHESYGVISINRTTGSKKLVGAMFDTLPGFITLRIHHAERNIDPHLHTEHYWPDMTPIVEVHMSAYQFAEAITMMNVGQGQPCTLYSMHGVHFDPVPEEATTPLEQITKDFARTGDEETVETEYFATIHDLHKTIVAAKLSKTKQTEILDHVDRLRRMASAPKAAAKYAADRVAETAEKVVTQAKVEIAASITNVVNHLGIKALREQVSAPQLTSHVDKEGS